MKLGSKTAPPPPNERVDAAELLLLDLVLYKNANHVLINVHYFFFEVGRSLLHAVTSIVVTLLGSDQSLSTKSFKCF